MAETPNSTIARCSRCGVEREAKPAKDGTAKLPRGWKRWRDEPWCVECWHRDYRLCSIEMMVVEPIAESWDVLGDRLRRAWRAATSAANVAIQCLQADDAVRVAAQQKLPAMPRSYRYPRLRERVPELDPSATTAVDHAVEGRWRARRYETLWLRGASAPSYRYPQPYPLIRRGWKLEEDAGGAMYFSARVLGEPTTLRIVERRSKGRHGRPRRTEILRRVIAGELLAGEASIIGRRRPQGGGSAHRGGVDAAAKAPAAVVVRIAVWCPLAEARQLDGTMTVRTCGDALLRWQVRDDDPQVFRADHARRHCRVHAERVQAMADDRKAEIRMPRRRARDMDARMDDWARKHRDRMTSCIQMAASSVVKQAARRRVARIEYDDTDRSYIGDAFPWHQLRDRIAQLAGESRIDFVASARVEAPPQEALAGESGQ